MHSPTNPSLSLSFTHTLSLSPAVPLLQMVKSQVIPQLIHPDGWSSGMTVDALSISRLNIKVDSTG
jgi:hypothetical protein